MPAPTRELLLQEGEGRVRGIDRSASSISMVQAWQALNEALPATPLSLAERGWG